MSEDMNNNTTPGQPPVTPPPVTPPPQGGKGKAIAAMVLGICAAALYCFWFVAIPAAIVGLVLAALVLKNKEPGRGFAIAGLVISIAAIVWAILFLAIFAAIINEANQAVDNIWGLYA